jgi:hypothetical protein
LPTNRQSLHEGGFFRDGDGSAGSHETARSYTTSDTGSSYSTSDTTDSARFSHGVYRIPEDEQLSPPATEAGSARFLQASPHEGGRFQPPVRGPSIGGSMSSSDQRAVDASRARARTAMPARDDQSWTTTSSSDVVDFATAGFPTQPHDDLPTPGQSEPAESSRGPSSSRGPAFGLPSGPLSGPASGRLGSTPPMSSRTPPGTSRSGSQTSQRGPLWYSPGRSPRPGTPGRPEEDDAPPDDEEMPEFDH